MLQVDSLFESGENGHQGQEWDQNQEIEGQYVLESPVGSPKSSSSPNMNCNEIIETIPFDPKAFVDGEVGYSDLMMEEMMSNYSLGLYDWNGNNMHYMHNMNGSSVNNNMNVNVNFGNVNGNMDSMNGYYNITVMPINEVIPEVKPEAKKEKVGEKEKSGKKEVKKKNDNKGTNKRKRSEESTVGSGDTLTIQLSREELLNISSAELESRIAVITSQRKLTAAELKEVKRQKRLVKNREYSQHSRAKKKVRMQELETTVEQLTEENKLLKQDNYSLQSRVNLLEEELKKYDPNFSTTIQSGGEYQPNNWFPQNVYPAVFFIILFSFAILFPGLYPNDKDIFIPNNNAGNMIFNLPAEKAFRVRDILEMINTTSRYTPSHKPDKQLTMNDVDKIDLLDQCFNTHYSNFSERNITSTFKLLTTN